MVLTGDPNFKDKPITDSLSFYVKEVNPIATRIVHSLTYNFVSCYRVILTSLILARDFLPQW